MSNENHNNSGDWRSRLETLDSLAAEKVIDKNASWEKLHDRLRGKKSSRKIIWYWPAAACLLLVLLIPLINSNKRPHGLAKTGTVQKQPGIISSPNALINKKDNVEIVVVPPFEKNQAITVEDKSLKKYQEVIPVAISKEIRLNNAVSNPDFIKETIILAPQPVEPSLNTAAALPANKKLKVVHINELGDPVEESPATARSADVHSFQLKLAGQEVYVNSSVASRAAGFTILKSKPSPN